MRRFALALALAACGGNEELVGGTWHAEEQAIAFTADARYHMATLSPASEEDGAWETQPDGLHLTPDVGAPWPALQWRISGDTLIIRWPPPRSYQK